MAKLERLITPSGVKTISENGEYDVASYEGVDVDVEVKARVEGTTLVIPKSTTAAPSMSGELLVDSNLDTGDFSFPINPDVIPKLKNGLFLVEYYQEDGMVSSPNTTIVTTCERFLIQGWDSNNNLGFINAYIYENTISFDESYSSNGMAFNRLDVLKIYKLPITFPTIEGE